MGINYFSLLGFIYSSLLFGVTFFGIKVYYIFLALSLVKISNLFISKDINVSAIQFLTAAFILLSIINQDYEKSLKFFLCYASIGLVYSVLHGHYLKITKHIYIASIIQAILIFLTSIVQFDSFYSSVLSLSFDPDRASALSTDPNKAALILLMLLLAVEKRRLTSFFGFGVAILLTKSRMTLGLFILYINKFGEYFNKYIVRSFFAVVFFLGIYFFEDIYNIGLLLSLLIRPEFSSIGSVDPLRERIIFELPNFFINSDFFYGGGLNNYILINGTPPHNGLYSLILDFGKFGALSILLLYGFLFFNTKNKKPLSLLFIILFLMEFYDFPLFYVIMIFILFGRNLYKFKFL